MGLRFVSRLFALVLGVVPAAALADEAEANRLLVEAVRLAEEAVHAPRDEAVGLYRRVAANLDAIVTEHPDSPYAPLIATNQPIGSFLPWQVRHELARLTAPAEQEAPAPVAGPCGGPCVWERQYGDGTGNLLTGDGEAYLLADVLPRPDGSSVVVGSYWAQGVRQVWLTGLDATGQTLWENAYPGNACDAAPIDGGFAVLAEDADENTDVGVLLLADDGSRIETFGLDYEAYGIAADGRGGFIVVGGRDGAPIVEAIGADGVHRWTWSATADLPAGDGVAFATAAVAIPGGLRVLGYQHRDGGAADATLWTATLGDDGRLRALTALEDFDLIGGRPCDLVSRHWSIDALGEDAVIRYLWADDLVQRHSTVARIDAGGGVVWSRIHPIPATEQPDPQAAIVAGVDEITAASVTVDGGVLVAGYRNRPQGAGAGFITLWGGDGGEVWRSDFRRVADEAWQEFTYLAAVEETADGGFVAVMTDGLQRFRIRAFVLHLGADGAMP